MLAKDTIIKVTNRDNGVVGYSIPEMNIRRLFQKGEIKEITMEELRKLSKTNKKYWRGLIQALPDSWEQKRTWTGNYQNLRNIYFARRNHKLTEWKDFCRWIEQLPYGKELICFE